MKNANRKKEGITGYRDRHLRRMKKRISEDRVNGLNLEQSNPIINILAREDSLEKAAK